MNKEKLWDKDFLLLLQGGAVSTAGDVLYTAAIGYSVLQQTGSTARMGIVSSIPMFATLFLMSFAGSFSDRANRKSIIIFMDTLRGVVMLTAGLMAYRGLLNITAIFIITVICSVAKVLFYPAVTVAYMDVIPPDKLMRGQSVRTTVSNLSSLLGEAVSGGFINLIGVPATIIVNGISFLFSAFTEIFITLPKPIYAPEIKKANVLKNSKEGLKIIFETPVLKSLVVTCISINLFSSGTGRLIMPFVLEKGLGVEHYGLIMSAASAGVMGCTAILAAKDFTPKSRYKLFRIGMIICYGFNILFALAGSFAVLFVTIGIQFIGNGMFNAVLNSRLFAAMPKENRGAVTGIVATASTGAGAISTLLYGFIGELIPMKTLFLAAALIVLIPGYFAYTNRNIKNLIENN